MKYSILRRNEADLIEIFSLSYLNAYLKSVKTINSMKWDVVVGI